MNDIHCGIFGTVLGNDLNEKECELLNTLGKIHELHDQEILIEEGKIDNSLHILISGSMAVTRQAAGGEWLTLHVLQQGEFAGAMGFIDGQEHSATLKAIGSARVFSIERNRFESLFETSPMLAYHIMRAIIRGVHNTLRRMNMQHLELNNYIHHQHGRY